MSHQQTTFFPEPETSFDLLSARSPAIDSSLADSLIRELKAVMRDLGRDGGIVSPAVYDTAQRLRLAPANNWESTLNWLIQQQQADGGWGDPTLPAYRDIPSLAAILALHQYTRLPRAKAAFQAGLNFLKTHPYYWQADDLDVLPIGAELIVPHLLAECDRVGLSIGAEPYAELLPIGILKQQKLQQMLAERPPLAGIPALYVWEAWGRDPDPQSLDRLGSCGNSPAATAAWWQAAANQPLLARLEDKVQNYLNQAAVNTMSGVPGVIPTVWPVEVFEITWGLEALLFARLINHPALEPEVLQQVSEIPKMKQTEGWGFSNMFVPDADDTATAIAALHATGQPIDISILKRFERDGVFATYIGERNPSVSATARGIRVLAMTGETPSQKSIETLLGFRRADGRWRDKWHCSWLYATLQSLLALLHAGEIRSLEPTIAAYLIYQNRDGGWGEGGRSTAEETAYGIIALLSLEQFGLLSHTHEIAIERGFRWLLKHFNPSEWSEDALYISKELYGNYRHTHVYILSAMLAVVLRNSSAN